jgi:hypothetical protein
VYIHIVGYILISVNPYEENRDIKTQKAIKKRLQQNELKNHFVAASPD